MKTETRTFYIASDGSEFLNQKECKAYENRKFRLNICHLTTTQMIDLLCEIFPCHIFSDKATVRIMIRNDSWSGQGFEFQIDTTAEDSIKGLIRGENDFELRSDSTWIKDVGYSLKNVYEYLESLDFWKDRITQPIKNSYITRDWKVICERQFSSPKYN